MENQKEIYTYFWANTNIIKINRRIKWEDDYVIFSSFKELFAYYLANDCDCLNCLKGKILFTGIVSEDKKSLLITKIFSEEEINSLRLFI